MNTRRVLAAIAGLLCIGLQPAGATTVRYDVTNLSANTWEYAYTVNNDTLGFNIEEFTVYFESGLYQNLAITGPIAVPGWDPLTVEPNNFLNNDGFYDALAVTGGLAPGDSIGGFTVRFDFLGTGVPGSQLFEVVDPVNFTVLDAGQTSLVPVPAAVWLLGSGIIGLFAFASRRT